MFPNKNIVYIGIKRFRSKREIDTREENKKEREINWAVRNKVKFPTSSNIIYRREFRVQIFAS